VLCFILILLNFIIINADMIFMMISKENVYFGLGRFPAQISAGISFILAEVILNFFRSLEANADIRLPVKQRVSIRILRNSSFAI
jgi:hypothetical protein